LDRVREEVEMSFETDGRVVEVGVGIE